ncbi:GIN domain-containing protein [Pseudonocardia hydrocarbonoxydans]|uniref:Putative auto-transporter adhesin head GIN domain-containing protein n=1 Tax=Pseudonocardia hydrocarbonoxydans TaxID=76726 RepID=A0A4Y3WI31_9PSEU|nr:DUF2807 domain-containing protein [Pseudonocardia hydrocarbonoxydans]GEC18385.1 hypothetical protein PHY01_06680 [Pseudonocardia hydrocarbonoxydans]
MPRCRTALLASLAAALTACATAPAPVLSPADGTTAPTAPTAGESRDVAGFTGVELSTVGDLVIEQTGTESLTIEAAPEVVPLLTSEVSGGVLRLGVAPGAEITTREPIVYRLTVAALDALSVSGAGDVTATGLRTERLTVEIDGAGDVTPAGEAGTQVVTVTGAGDYDAEGLSSRTAEITVEGTGDAVVAVSERLDVRIDGVGSVEYIGDPVVTRDIDGVGSVQPR